MSLAAWLSFDGTDIVRVVSKGDDRSIEYAQILQGFTELAEVECGCCFGEFVEVRLRQLFLQNLELTLASELCCNAPRATYSAARACPR